MSTGWSLIQAIALATSGCTAPSVDVGGEVARMAKDAPGELRPGIYTAAESPAVRDRARGKLEPVDGADVRVQVVATGRRARRAR